MRRVGLGVILLGIGTARGVGIAPSGMGAYTLGGLLSLAAGTLTYNLAPSGTLETS